MRLSGEEFLQRVRDEFPYAVDGGIPPAFAQRFRATSVLTLVRFDTGMEETIVARG
ncbi:hypothetical protein [Streptomyces sp. NPDC096152]|uniref:hypothetical protein n=1 Tax=Streptomyces sp. NPDC096152 TaxID=3366078 RepID=UPI0038076D66